MYGFSSRNQVSGVRCSLPMNRPIKCFFPRLGSWQFRSNDSLMDFRDQVAVSVSSRLGYLGLLGFNNIGGTTPSTIDGCRLRIISKIGAQSQSFLNSSCCSHRPSVASLSMCNAMLTPVCFSSGRQYTLLSP